MSGDCLKYVGKTLPIHDAPGKVRGTLKYTGDLKFDGMLHAKLLFSPWPHAKILSIDAVEALSMPGVVGVFTHENTPKTAYNSQVWFEGQQAMTSEDERIFTDTVRYVGDRVAAVLAVDDKTAREALGLIKVEYEKLPFYLDPEKVPAQEGVIHPVSEPFFRKELKCGSPEEVFAGAELVAEDRIETPKVHHAALEPHVCLALPDHNGKITVLSPCQIIYAVRLNVARVLGLPFNKVRVIKTPMGGSFGGKQEVILEPLCAYLALKTGKPVKVELERRACIASTRTRTKVISYVKTAADRQGKILARDFRVLADTGAYTSNGAALVTAMGKKLFRLYRVANQRYQGMAVHTNTPVAGAARGYGTPQIMAISEINLDHTARKLGLDPLEFRLKNLVRPNDPDLSGGPSLGDARIVECAQEGAGLFAWYAKRRRPPGQGRFRKGVGMACCTHGNGYFGAFQDFVTMTLRMLEDGSMILLSGLHDLGCGTITSIKQIVAEVMDIDPGRIEMPEGDTETSPYDIGSQASRVMHVCGGGALKIAEAVKELFSAQAALILDCAQDDVVMCEEMVWSRRDPEGKYSYGDIASRAQRQNQTEIIITETYRATDNPGSYGANFAEVEVDTLTGLVRVLDVVAAFDVGKAINPGFVEGQIYGGIQMGLGMALTEDLDIDPVTGIVRGDSLANYHIVNAPDMPPVRVLLIEKGENDGPYGAKSIGEIATCAIAPAIVNAVNHALGTGLSVLPLTPMRILSGLKKKEG
ncbi:molybdopterin-dependent oxidoreductase [Desulfosporosinus sp. PR]|uniref:xanthine dehydrogenase family protein molybdopterin-binding subunit n=1 Tax=Candidatus Desulfosporosinus nitrosoreducens TaxID=3401928 RepID=UPI0027F97A42|nr:molybdopterin cofactor-binding domain-containing protein [Desulfosporosinus sp. PR]MDQ7096341.1 molybdopterin-dependent oxidoreductase [Desulfosporosinus sp. PR]